MKRKTTRQKVQENIRKALAKEAEQRFVSFLDKAIDAAYEAGIENRGDVLTLPLVELHRRLTGSTPTP